MNVRGPGLQYQRRLRGEVLFWLTALSLITAAVISASPQPGTLRPFPIVANGVLGPFSGKQPSVRELEKFYGKIWNANFSMFITNMAVSTLSIGHLNPPDTVLNALQHVNSLHPESPLKALLYDRNAVGSDDEAQRGRLRSLLGHQDVAGFFIDEPTPDQLRATGKWASDLLHLSQGARKPIMLVNLFGDQAAIVKDYYAYVHEWISVGHPEVLSFDNYPLWDDARAAKHGDAIGSNWQREYFWNLEMFRQASLRYHIPFWTWIGVHEHWSSYSHIYYRRATAGDIRLQVYSALCYGACGILYYNFWNPPELAKTDWHEKYGLLDYKMRETSLLRTVTQLNKTVQALGSALQLLESVGVYHSTVQILKGTAAVASNVNRARTLVAAEPAYEKSDTTYGSFGTRGASWNDTTRLQANELQEKFVAELLTSDAMIGLFRDRTTREAYALVVSKNLRETKTVTFDIDASKLGGRDLPTRVMVHDVARSDRGQTVSVKGGKARVSVRLLSGEGALLKISGR